MEDIKTVYDVLNHFKNTKRRLTQGGDSDFITLDYNQLLALIELSKREQQELFKTNEELFKANDKLNEIEECLINYIEVEPEEGSPYAIKVEFKEILEIIKGDD